MKIKKVIGIGVFFAILAMLLHIMSGAFMAIDSSDIENIEGFYAEPENSIDMVVMGPSEIYTGYAPAMAWKEYGLKSCNLSIGAVPCNMYKSMIKEILRTQQPKLLVVSAAGFSHGDWNLGDEVYLRKWVDSMPFSENKLETLEEDVPTVATDTETGESDSTSESSSVASEDVRKNISDTMYFTLEKYHGNWKDPRAVAASFVTRSYMTLSGGGYLKGYYAKADRTGGRDNLANIGQPTEESYVLTDSCRTYLEEFLAYCKNAGVQHLLMLQPPHETEAADKSGLDQIKQITESYGYDFLDLSTDLESVGIDDANDFCDFEHLNVYGTRKLTSYLGKLAVDKYGIHSETTDSEKSRWEKSVKKTEEVMDMCESCIDRGALMGFGELEATDMYQWYFKNKYLK